MSRNRALALGLICLLAITLRVAYRAYAGSADFWHNGYIFFYAIDCCFAVVTETLEDNAERDQALSKLFGAYSTVSG